MRVHIAIESIGRRGCRGPRRDPERAFEDVEDILKLFGPFLRAYVFFRYRCDLANELMRFTSRLVIGDCPVGRIWESVLHQAKQRIDTGLFSKVISPMLAKVRNPIFF